MPRLMASPQATPATCPLLDLVYNQKYFGRWSKSALGANETCLSSTAKTIVNRRAGAVFKIVKTRELENDHRSGTDFDSAPVQNDQRGRGRSGPRSARP